GGGTGKETKSSDSGAAADTGPKGGPKTAVEGKGHGTLKGTVVYDGTPPDMATADKEIQTTMKDKDEKNWLAGPSGEEKAAFQWRVNPQNKGVKNVIVWLSPGDNAYFKLSDAEKKPVHDQVVIDQPHCAFIPHCAVAFTCYNDGSKFVKTGQKIIFK